MPPLPLLMGIVITSVKRAAFMWNDWLDPFSQKLAGLLQPVINDGGRPCLTNTSRAQLSTGPPLCFPRGLSLIVYIVYMPCAQRKPSPHWSNQRHGNCSGTRQTKLPTGEEDCCITCRLSSKSRVLSEARVICEIWLSWRFLTASLLWRQITLWNLRMRSPT